MATIHEFGTAPLQAKDGYRIIGLQHGTDEELLAMFKDNDVRLVRGPSLHGRPGEFEFALMKSDDTLYFNCKAEAEWFASAVRASDEVASVEYDLSAVEVDDTFCWSVTYTGPVVSLYSESTASVIGRRASRFVR